jgi:hypothetical protein
MLLQTEYEFVLPLGYIDETGTVHREGTMRLATGADEILPLADPRVQKNPAYLTLILLSRVVTRLGSLEPINPKTMESLFAGDLAYLQDLYNAINGLAAPDEVVCPSCDHVFLREVSPSGESSAIPSNGSTRRWPSSLTTSTGPELTS